MLVDTKNIVPEFTLPRYNCDKKIWIKAEKIFVDKTEDKYEVYYFVNRNTGKMKYVYNLPKYIELDERFKLAIVAFMCEGTDPKKGIFTKFSGNKGRSIQFSNSDYWLVKLIVDEFEKLGISRDKWAVYLTLFPEHETKKEIKWWSKILNIKGERFRLHEILEGNPDKKSYNPHGRVRIETTSVVHTAIIDNLINLTKENKL